MLSKCANPECSEIFRYLHQGKLFHLCPSPEVQALIGPVEDTFYERFWLCDKCSKQFTLVWEGTRVKVAPLPLPLDEETAPPQKQRTLAGRLRGRAASASRDDG